jgi:serine protease Do
MGTRFIRTDSAINSGNSGGGLFDINGNLVGINDAKISSASVENIAYAIPSNVAIYAAQNVIDHYEKNGASGIRKFQMGITVQKMALGTRYNAETGLVETWETMRVSEISDSAWAASTSLQVGDELQSVKVGDQLYQLAHTYELSDLLLKIREGETVTLTVLRNGETVTISGVASAQFFADPDAVA